MNVTNFRQYAQQTFGIKDPRKIMDIQHKLVFIYPLLVADKVTLPGVQNLTNLLRDFISVTFLTDLFIENSFNIIRMVDQIRPLWDEKRQELPSNIELRDRSRLPNYPIDPVHSPVLQQKLDEKKAVIQQLLRTDPKLAKMRPYIQTVTLGNLIDVPVIVGTAPYPVDTLTLMYVLIAAIGLNRKLDNQQDLDVIFRELSSMDDKKYWQLLQNITSDPAEVQQIAGWFRGKAFKVLRSVDRWKVPVLSLAARNLALKIQKDVADQKYAFRQSEIMDPLLLNKSNLQQTKLYFQFVIDPDFAKKRFGIDASNENTKLANLSDVKLQGQLKAIQNYVISMFLELMGTAGIVLMNSIQNLLVVNPTKLDFNKLRSEFIDNEMVKNIDKHLTEVMIAIDNGLKGVSVEESRYKISILKSLCEINSGDTISDFSKLISRVNIVSDDFGLDVYKQFISVFNTICRSCSSQSSKIEKQLNYIVSSQERNIFMNRLNLIRKDIADAVNGIFDPYAAELTSQTDVAYSRVADVTNNSPRYIGETVVPGFISGMIDIFYFLFLSQLQGALCRFILTADVDLETVSHEVTAWPNYTLVLPIEIVLALHSATMGASWKHLLSGGREGQRLRTKDERTVDAQGEVTHKKKDERLTPEQIASRDILRASESYVKAIIKYISKRLNVPNLVVIDSKRGDIYYKFMNNIDINKAKNTTIQTFIRSTLNKELTL